MPASDHARSVTRSPRPVMPVVVLDIVGKLPPGVSRRRLGRLVDDASRYLDLAGRAMTVRFASDTVVRRFNHQYRGIARTTDVLSFPASDPDGAPMGYLGDLLISRDRAALQAKRGGLTLGREVDELVLHGLLHLLGFDHETDNGEMNRRELELRARLLDAPGANR